MVEIVPLQREYTVPTEPIISNFASAKKIAFLNRGTKSIMRPINSARFDNTGQYKFSLL